MDLDKLDLNMCLLERRKKLEKMDELFKEIKSLDDHLGKLVNLYSTKNKNRID